MCLQMWHIVCFWFYNTVSDVYRCDILFVSDFTTQCQMFTDVTYCLFLILQHNVRCLQMWHIVWFWFYNTMPAVYRCDILFVSDFTTQCQMFTDVTYCLFLILQHIVRCLQMWHIVCFWFYSTVSDVYRCDILFVSDFTAQCQMFTDVT